MKIKNQFTYFCRTFFRIRVSIFILIGVGIIFLTFLTNNNALEIAISGIASVFIGIGVNNFSSYETKLKDEKRLKEKMLYFIKTCEFIQSKISKLNEEVHLKSTEMLKQELADLEQLNAFTIQLMQEDDLLK